MGGENTVAVRNRLVTSFPGQYWMGAPVFRSRESARKKLLKIKFHSVDRALVLRAGNPEFGPQQHVSRARTSVIPVLWS